MEEGNSALEKGFESADTCAICRNDLANLCTKCEAEYPNGNACKVAVGYCQHAFHEHCISAWLANGRRNCPLDTSAWECKKRKGLNLKVINININDNPHDFVES